ncbi:uncharacterized protein G6M90_00g003360 [Metarhizium brunneum]|uniref:Uncharacterized protein n=1 Tax=Metarhizium brunneum TaxID=500148 RepID=A0A7D5YN67_9HYPO|nr:hypothetical protein G6M90_00g003360 [Metarhizium brunneum]
MATSTATLAQVAAEQEPQVTNFFAYEKVAETVFASLGDKSKLSDGTQTVVNLGSGLIAGFAAAIIFQPADTVLSKINKTTMPDCDILSLEWEAACGTNTPLSTVSFTHHHQVRSKLLA